MPRSHRIRSLLVILLSIVWMRVGADSRPADPPPEGVGLAFVLSDTLLDYGLERNLRSYTSFDMPTPSIPALDNLSQGTPGPWITPHFINRYNPTIYTDEYNFVRRLPPLARREPVDAWWWVYGAIINDRHSWIFTAHPNREALTADDLGERLRTGARSLPLPQPSYQFFEPCYGQDDPALPPVHTLEPVPVAFTSGDGWATLHLCVDYGWWIGDGFECGGCGVDYTARLWYSFHGVTADGAYLIHLTVPLEIDQLPTRSAEIITCQTSAGQWERRFSPALDQWEALGWLPDDPDADPVQYCHPRLTEDALAQYLEQVVRSVTKRRDRLDRDDSIAAIFDGLNETFATLRLDISAIPPPVPINQ